MTFLQMCILYWPVALLGACALGKILKGRGDAA